VEAQSPTALPLVQAGNLAYLGSFTLPSSDGTGQPGEAGSLLYGGRGLAVRDETLYFGCHQYSDALARVSIPATGGVASIVEPCVRVPNLEGVDGSDGGEREIGGGLWHGGRLIVSGYAFYDADGDAVASHFAGGSVASLVGPVRLSGAEPGAVGGYMAVVPEEWRALLGGPALTGLCCVSIITRSSFGPSVSVFNPDDVGVRTPVPSTLLVRYGSDEFPASGGDWRGMIVGGVAFPAGTRSVLFVGRAGVGPTCYGTGLECGDPTSSPKGYHSYPYRHRVWAYDANDLLAVKQGRRRPNEVQPYGVWDLPEMQPAAGDAPMRSATYDPATRRLYVVTDSGSAAPRVHVYLVTTAVIQPPPRPPVGFSASVTGDVAGFTWSAPSGNELTGYQLEGGGAPSATSFLLPLPAASTTASLPAPPGIYYVRLRANYAGGGSAVSNELRIVVNPAAVPDAPVNVRAVVAGSEVVFSWEPLMTPGVDVLLEAGTAPGQSNLVPGHALGTRSPVVVSGVPAGTYYARLRARNANGGGPPSNEVAIAVGSQAVAPARPEALQAAVSPSRTVSLQWRHGTSAGPATRFAIEAGSAPGVSDVGVMTIAPVDRYDVVAVPRGVYYVRMRAANTAGVSPPSSEVRVVVE
jgi:hypothetical protein